MFLRKLFANLGRRRAPAPRDVKALLAAPEAAVREGRADEALALLDALLAREPGLAPAHLMLGTVLEPRQRYGDAREHYLRASELDRDGWVAPLRLGLLALERG